MKGNTVEENLNYVYKNKDMKQLQKDSAGV